MTNLSVKVHEMDDVLSNECLVTRLRQLSLGGFSGMNVALNAFQTHRVIRHIDAKAIVAYVSNDGEESLLNARGWALWSKDASNDAYRSKPGICFQVYVQPDYRHQGIASKLLKKAAEISSDEKVMVYWHDAPSFFQLHRDLGYNVVSIYDEE